ncbi:DUF4411 family protein [Variovorax sp. LT2P21]|uniref:DUF4411 family protein n=1 Tax=Variovorax sp. LT2P21 TaxID=3443731 RepID=UPI003F4794CE
MLYLLDANVLITAHNSYYAVDSVPEYWEWLAYQGEQGRVKMPFEIFEEVKDGPADADKDLLFAWLQEDVNKKALLLSDVVDPALVQMVTASGYAADLTDDEVEQIGRDPFLIAYALSSKDQRCVVTVETSAPKKQRHNRKIPDVCNSLGQGWCNPFEFNRALGFSTQWKQKLGK